MILPVVEDFAGFLIVLPEDCGNLALEFDIILIYNAFKLTKYQCYVFQFCNFVATFLKRSSALYKFFYKFI